jgi:polar amino acid transport system substrate-binding protein
MILLGKQGIIVFLIFFLCSNIILAQGSNPPSEVPTQADVIVVTKEFAPFVFQKNDKFYGFSIDLWEVIAETLNLDYTMYRVHDVPSLLSDVEQGKATCGLAGVSITADREKYLDFSYNYYESGLQIMIQQQDQATSFQDAIVSFIGGGLIHSIALFFVLLLIASHIIWLAERRKNEAEFPRPYFKGIWESFWWATVTVTTVGYGDKTPRGKWGRLFGIIWMITGLFLIANFTASITTSLTLKNMEEPIQGVADLFDKHVATIPGSTTANYFDTIQLDYQPMDSVEDAAQALKRGKLDAFVYDAPVLMYYVTQHPEMDLRLVGPSFKREFYGIVFPSKSPLREPVNQALLQIKESGEYKFMLNKWFGTNSRKETN